MSILLSIAARRICFLLIAILPISEYFIDCVHASYPFNFTSIVIVPFWCQNNCHSLLFKEIRGLWFRGIKKDKEIPIFLFDVCSSYFQISIPPPSTHHGTTAPPQITTSSHPPNIISDQNRLHI